MNEKDEFGHDPAVRAMRMVFARMEQVYRNTLEAAALSPFDRRLRVWREQSLQLFEQAWAKAGRQGLAKTEDDVTALYARCLVRVLEKGKVSVPAGIVAPDEAFERVVQEIGK